VEGQPQADEVEAPYPAGDDPGEDPPSPKALERTRGEGDPAKTNGAPAGGRVMDRQAIDVSQDPAGGVGERGVAVTRNRRTHAVRGEAGR